MQKRNPFDVAHSVFRGIYEPRLPREVPTIADLRRKHQISERAARILRDLLIAATESVKTIAAPDAVPDEAPKDSGRYEIRDGAYYFAWRDETGARAARIPEEDFKRMVRAYVQDGDNEAMQIVATRFGLARKDFHKIKSIYGLTKLHEPFTVEELEVRDEDSLTQDHLALKRRRHMKRVEREDFQQIQAGYRKWLALESGLLNPFRELLDRVLGERSAPEPLVETPKDGRHLVVYQGSDLHLGLAVPGVYDRKEAARRWRAGLQAAWDGVVGRKVEDVTFLLLIGGDAAHADTYGGTTTKGTQLDVDGMPETILNDVVLMYLAGIDALLAHGARVMLVCVPGNHDEMLARAAMMALFAAYRNSAQVTFGNFTEPYAHVIFGNSAILLHHGHGKADAVALGAILESRMRKTGEGAKYRYAITGNLHHLAAKEDNNMMLLQQPSPAPADRWHGLKGYGEMARCATTVYYFDSIEGLVNMRYVGFE